MSEQNIVIRKASPDDAEELLKIYTPYVKNTAISFEYEVPSVEEFRGRIVHTLKRYPYLVAECGGEIVGYTYAGEFKSRNAYDWAVETTVYIKQDKRRNGIGRLLYVALEKTLKRQGILNMNACIAVPEDKDEHLTKDSPSFHEKMGFQLVGTFHQCGYKFNHWYDMVWMEKMIGKHVSNQPQVIPFSEIK